jgi:hypothetical protein
MLPVGLEAVVDVSVAAVLTSINFLWAWPEIICALGLAEWGRGFRLEGISEIAFNSAPAPPCKFSVKFVDESVSGTLSFCNF